MMESVSILNETMELSQYRNRWTFDDAHCCWCLEDILYTQAACVPKFQRLSIFVPTNLMNGDGSMEIKAKDVPVIFENNSAGYMQMPHVWLDGPRCYAQQYLDRGFVYVSCGCRGRESRDAQGKAVGKGPVSIVDLKTAIRFLRHNRQVLPGNWDKIISVGWSAGGAMSSLLATSGDNKSFLTYLRQNGAFMEESDAVFAAQIYCPIVDLEHADLAYEWMFHADKTCEDSPAGPAETMTPFKEALSELLAARYVRYFNSLQLKDPLTGKQLLLREDGRGGSGYEYLMALLNRSAADYLSRLQQGSLPEEYSAADYLQGNYTHRVPVPMPPKPLHRADIHHAGPGEALPERRFGAMALGDLVSRPPKGMPFFERKPEMVEVSGTDKRQWLSWDGSKAEVSDLDSYVLHHRRRMKPCTSFDKLEMDSGENQAFGTPEKDYVHFNSEIADAIAELKHRFPEEYARYYAAFAAAAGDAALKERIRLINPLSFIATDEISTQAKHYRIRVGAADADTSLTVSMTLAVKLMNSGCGSVDYGLVWDQPHCEADYPGEVCNWIEQICKES